MRHLLALLLLLPLAVWAQAPAAEPAQEAKPADSEAEAKPAEPAADTAAAESPAPETERWISGTLDFGYRWVSDTGGNFNSYRSVIDLGEGPKLFGLDLTLQPASSRLLDRLDIFAYNWGGEPYTTARLFARKQRAYQLSFDYRNIDYFNFLPSFANPLVGQGALIPQRAFDTRRGTIDTELELFPSARIVPYVAFTRNSGDGSGITPFQTDSNEYPVPTRLRDETNNYRGGVRFEMNRWHVTLEQGGLTFKDDQRVFTDQRNPGNRTTPFFGEQLFIDGLEQAYGVRGSSFYSKGLVTANPASWANLYGQFLFSQPTTDVNYGANASGLLTILAARRFYTGQQEFVASESRMPHISGSLSLEIRSLDRLRILGSWMTDRFHNASSISLTDVFLFAASPDEVERAFQTDRLDVNYNRSQIDAFFDVTRKITLRGGYRYVWGDATTRAPQLNPSATREQGEVSRHVGIAGFNIRPSQNLSANFEYEGSSADRTYFRTSLQDFHKVRSRFRYQIRPSLQTFAYFWLVKNQNPAPAINLDFTSAAGSIGAQWIPSSNKWVSVIGEYTRSKLDSNISFIDPTDFSRTRSIYEDHAHTVTGMLDVNLPAIHGQQPKLTAGGSMFLSTGSRPTDYHQPVGRFLVPFGKHVHWYAEWRWYGFFETLYRYEEFRTHHFITGFRLNL